MKVIFVSGPYRADSTKGILSNIRKSRKVALRLWSEGWAVICPHSNTALFDGECDDNVWLDGDMEILRRCDAVYMMEGWIRSMGASAEHELARELGMEIYYQ